MVFAWNRDGNKDRDAAASARAELATDEHPRRGRPPGWRPRLAVALQLVVIAGMIVPGALLGGPLPAPSSQVQDSPRGNAAAAAPQHSGKRARAKRDRRQDRQKETRQGRKKHRQTDRKRQNAQQRNRQHAQQRKRQQNIADPQKACIEGGGIWLAEVKLCTHGPDPVPPGLGLSITQSVEALPAGDASQAAAALVCDGNGTSGNRIQVLYVRGSNVTSRYTEYLSSFRAWVGDANQIFLSSAQETGGTRNLRLVHDANCQPVIQEVVIPPTTATGSAAFKFMVTELQKQGFTRIDRKYLAFVDTTSAGLCGIGDLWLDDRASGSVNFNNIKTGYARVDAGCWHGKTVAHEVMHNMGGVQNSAPHTSLTPGLSRSGGHCIDEWDVMCYSDHDLGNNLPPVTIVCTDRARDLTRFDCNHDDYYHTNPAAGSYLATHWNTANNRFLIVGPNGTTPPPVDHTAPVVTWSAPVGNGQSLKVPTGTVGLTVAATDNTRVQEVIFRRWNVAANQWITLGTDVSAPYTATVDVASLANGKNQISATATDTAGNAGSATISIERGTSRKSPPPRGPRGGPKPPKRPGVHKPPKHKGSKKNNGKKNKKH